MSRIDEIRERAAKATGAPWNLAIEEDEPDPLAVVAYDGEIYIATVHARGLEHAQELVDAQFIAHSRVDVDYLLSECDAKDATIAELRAEVDRSQERDPLETIEWTERVQVCLGWLAVCHDCGWRFNSVNRDEIGFEADAHRQECDKRDRSQEPVLSTFDPNA